MALPPSVPVGTVTGTWYTPSGALAVGTIVFLLMESVEVPDDPDGVVIPVKTVVDVPAGVLNQTLPAGIYAVSLRLSELYRESKLIEVVAGQALNLPDAIGLTLPNPVPYQTVRSVDGYFPDASGNIDLPGGGGGGAVDSVFGRTGVVVAVNGDYTKSQVGLGNVDNTSDAVKPVSAATQTALDSKEASGAASAAVAAHVALPDPHTQYLKEADAAPVATSGTYASLTGKPTIPVASDTFPTSVGQFNTAGTSPDFSRADHTHNGVPQTLLTTKGDLIVATANNTAARQAIGTDGQVLVSDSGQTNGLKWTARERSMYPPSADGLISAAGELSDFKDNSALGTPAWIARVFIPAGSPITTAWTAIHAAGTVGAGGENSFAVYTDAGVFVASTPTDDNLWTVTGPRSKSFSTPIPAQTSDRYVYMGIRVTGYSGAPSFSFFTSSASAGLLDGGFGSGKRRSIIANSGSTWVGSFDPATYGALSVGYMPFLAVS